MTSALETPFAIGQQMWMAVGNSEQTQHPCPICNGNLGVTIILGTGEHLGVLCDGCGLGFDGPRGFIKEWEQHPRAVSFVIGSVKGFRDGEWEVLSTEGGWAYFKDLFVTEAEALGAAVINAEKQHESNMQSRQRIKKSAQHLTWSARYHRDCIKDLQRQIDWHTSRLSSGKVKKEKA